MRNSIRPITVHRAADRGRTRLAWLESAHTFSFGEFQDPGRRGFRTLRVINDDRVSPGKGFGAHPHRDMEIISYVIEGALEHKDSLGNGSVIRPGDVQKMSAGTGVTHSEFNPSRDAAAHFLQIWIIPERRGLPPEYGQAPTAGRTGLTLIGSNAPADGAVSIRQDAMMYLGRLATGQTVTHELASGRGAWLQIIAGELAVSGETLAAGDGAAVEAAGPLDIRCTAPAEFILFDLK